MQSTQLPPHHATVTVAHKLTGAPQPQSPPLLQLRQQVLLNFRDVWFDQLLGMPNLQVSARRVHVALR